MKTCYVRSDTRAIADLTDYYGKGMMITRINVPKLHRGKGVGSSLLREILADADRTRTYLYLEIAPSDGLDYDALAAWYRRYGFRDMGGVFMRRPDTPIPATPRPTVPRSILSDEDLLHRLIDRKPRWARSFAKFGRTRGLRCVGYGRWVSLRNARRNR